MDGFTNSGRRQTMIGVTYRLVHRRAEYLCNLVSTLLPRNDVIPMMGIADEPYQHRNRETP